MNIYMEDVEGVIEQEVAAGHAREDIALTYAFGLIRQRDGLAVDWARINTAILARFKPSGLAWIKKRAWARLAEKEPI